MQIIKDFTVQLISTVKLYAIQTVHSIKAFLESQQFVAGNTCVHP